MIPLSTWTLFVVTSALLAYTPGPDVIYVMTRGMAQGRRAALAAAAGFALGNFGHTFFAVVGLSALITSSAPLFAAIRYAGGLYIIYVGWRLFRSRGSFVPDGAAGALQCRVIFRQSILANLMNPKVALFFLAFFPQFVDPKRGSVALQMLLLGTTFVLVTIVCFGSVALAAGEIGRWLNRSARAGELVGRVAGGILIALGLRLAWPET